MSNSNNSTVSNSANSQSNVAIVKATVVNVRTANKDVLEYDEVSKTWSPVYKADGSKAQYHRLELTLSESVPVILAGTFEDTTSNTLVVSSKVLADAAAKDDFDVACLQADAEDKGLQTLSNSVVMRLIHKAVVELEVLTRNVGDEYITADGEVKTCEHKHYRTSIKSVTIAEGALAKAEAQLAKL